MELQQECMDTLLSSKVATYENVPSDWLRWSLPVHKNIHSRHWFSMVSMHCDLTSVSHASPYTRMDQTKSNFPLCGAAAFDHIHCTRNV